MPQKKEQKMTTQWVGIDVAAKSISVAMWDEATKRSQYIGEYNNDESGFAQMETAIVEQMEAEASISLVVEATGGYELRLLSYAYERQWGITLPNPKQVRDFAKGNGRRNKTDRADAQMLADYGATKQPQTQQLLPAELVELDELVQRRLQLEKQLRAEKSRLKQWQQRPRPTSAVTDSLQRTIDHLNEELAAIEDAIKSLLTSHPQHKRMVNRLLTAPGVGHKTVLHIFLVLHRFHVRTNGNGTAKGIVAFTGLDPTHFSSGSSIYKPASISKMGDSTVRNFLYMGALGGIRGHNPLRRFYLRLIQYGKPKRKALVASARKILVWCFALFHNRVDFDPSFHPIPQSAS